MSNHNTAREEKLRIALREHQDFLLRRLQEEWHALEKAAKREALVRQAKTAGFAVGKAVLALAAVAGILTIAVVAPNVLGAAGRFSGRRKFFHKRDFQRAAKYLKRKNLATVRKSQDQYIVELTERGLNTALAQTVKNLRVKRAKHWDGVWRIVLFDIPDARKWARDALRSHLRNIGFHQMQKSAFVTPYPCDEEVEFLISLLDIRDDIRFIKTREMQHDADIRGIFSV